MDYSAFTIENEATPETPKFKVGDRVRITNHKILLSKCCTENWSREIFVSDSVLKTNLWTDNIKDLNG